MNHEEKKAKIQEYVQVMMDEAVICMMKNVKKALDSGAVDIEGWDEESDFLSIPEALLIAVIETEGEQCKINIKKHVEKHVRKIKNHLK